MYVLLSALISLLATTAYSASARSSILPASTALFPNVTETKTQPILTSSPEHTSATDVRGSCYVVINETLTMLGSETETILQTDTFYTTITLTLFKLIPSAQVVNESLLLTETRCSDCIKTSTEAQSLEAQTASNPALEATVGESITLTEKRSDCVTSTNLVTVTKPSEISAVVASKTITKTERVIAPVVMTSTTALVGTSGEIATALSSETKPLSAVPSMSATAIPERSQANTDRLPKPTSNPPPNIVEASTIQSASSNPTPQSSPSRKPASGPTESEEQVQRVRMPNVIQSQLPAGSAQSAVLSTQISLQQSTIPVVPVPAPQPPIITLGTDMFEPAASSFVYVINGETLAPGGPAITVSNSVLSLATTSGTELVVALNTVSNGQPPSPATTIQLSSNPSQTPAATMDAAPAPAPTLVIATIGSSPITLNPSASSLVFTPPAGTPITILPGSPALTLPDGTVVSLSPATSIFPSPTLPSVLIISDLNTASAQSITFPLPVSPSPSNVDPLISTITSAYLPVLISSPPFIIVGGSTLSPNGPAATISGMSVSFGTGSSNFILVVGSSTITIAPTETGIGGYLYSGLINGAGVQSVTLGAGSTSDSGPGSRVGMEMTTSTLQTVAGNMRNTNTAGEVGLSPGSDSAVQQPRSGSTASTDPGPQANSGMQRISMPRPWVWEKSRMTTALLGVIWGLFVLRLDH